MSTTDDPSTTGSAESGTPGPGGPDESSVTTPAPPGFGLIFQAPDLSELPARKPRRSRTEGKDEETSGSEHPSQGASAPEEDSSEHASADGPDKDEDGGADEAGAADEGSSGGQGESGSSKGRRRKRGGKGRGRGRGRSGGDADSGSANDSSQATDSGDEAVAGESDDGGSSKQAAGQSKQGAGQSKNKGGQQRSKTQNDESSAAKSEPSSDSGEGEESEGSKRRRRRRRSESPERGARDEVTGVRGSTRLEAKRQRRREGREVGRRRTVISEAEFLARRESVERVMVVRGMPDRTQIGVLEDDVLVEHYVSRDDQSTSVGNVYLGRVQNVLPSMEAAFVDIGKGRNAVLYAGEVNWDAAGLEVNQAKRIENALTSGQNVLVQVTKDPIGHKGARLTSQVSLPGRFLVYVPGNSMTGISRKLPDTERARLKRILREVVPEDAGVIVRTAAEGASEADLRADVERLTALWEQIKSRSESKTKTASGPVLLHSEPDMTVRVIRDVFNEDFAKLIVSGDQAWRDVSQYIERVAPDLRPRVEQWSSEQDVFAELRVTEALAKAMDRKVWLPSGGSLVIDRTEAMTVVDVNTGKFVGSGGNLEETVTKNNIEAAEEIVRQLRLRDVGGIIVIDFIDMVLESNRDLVVRRLLECLGRDRTKHQVAEVTSLGLVQMTRKRVGSGLVEVFSESCGHCAGRGIIVHSEPVDAGGGDQGRSGGRGRGSRKSRGANGSGSTGSDSHSGAAKTPSGPTAAQIAAAAHAAAVNASSHGAESAGSGEEVGAGVAHPRTQEAEAPDPSGSQPEPEADVAPESRPDPEAASTVPRRQRRARGRVVAPAGPPAATTPEDEQA
ncbi:MAG TPA: Rne/Rng family ribonuclease [Ornithinimicrobium sp.]|uniref:Rne/Rng family ribonuclease n=1 Tax=Ornithinimicrobium sp. TaxID=1977084 RepID=UPI002B489A8F|nr:Rne/Rng family ribonuclease [Ornithinimicrobium sp.]HKJ11990.1 Rne/Rng family ribonuclease [Ornithinimicrobium sp.]